MLRLIRQEAEIEGSPRVQRKTWTIDGKEIKSPQVHKNTRTIFGQEAEV